MEAEANMFDQLVKNAQRILITSHISPDPDAISSLLLLGTTLQLNFPSKKIVMALEEKPDGLDFLEGYSQIRFGAIVSELHDYKPELFILLDGNNYERGSRHDGEKVRQFIKFNKIKTVVIDHHELAGADKVDVFINNHSPSTVQDVYELCFKKLRLSHPEAYAQLTMTGVFADTGGFVYMKDGQHKGLFALAEELVEAGANIEDIKNNLSRYTTDDMNALSMLISNISQGPDYSFSYLSDEFVSEWEKSGKTLAMLQKPTGSFLDNYIRNIGDKTWGFIVYRNTLQGENMYSVSLRAAGDTKDVSAIATQLGGGGHKPAAGAKFSAPNIQAAVARVRDTIENVSVS